MSKTLAAQEQTLGKIFSDDYVFRIPGYQRPYAWTTEQARELLDDLLGFMRSAGGAVENMPPYFLGSIVLIKQEASPESDVVDGQQRLTTVTLLLAAIRAALDSARATEITPLIYEKGSGIRGTKDRFRLTLRDRDRDFFQMYVQRENGLQSLIGLEDELSDSQENLRGNARLFGQRLAALSAEERVLLAQFIVTRCYLVVVATPDLDAAYRIFSVLNSRGLDLTATDILKAEIVGSIGAAQRESYTSKWEAAEEDLGRDAFGELFSHIRMVYRKIKPQGTLLKEFKEHVPDLGQPTKFIDAVLLPMTRAYEELSDAAYESTSYADRVNEHLRWLNRLEFKDWMPPALAFMTRSRQVPERVLQFVGDLERLGYAMLILKFGINERIERFGKLTAEVEAAKGLHAESSTLQLTPYEQDAIYARLDGPIYETLSARARSSILLRLDALLSGGGAQYEYETVSVEHVLPQQPSAGSKWIEWFPDAKERVQWVHRLGNLALLTRRKNSAASNYDFAAKKKAYFTRGGISPFVLTTQVLEKNEWTQTVVEERQKQLLGVLEAHMRLQGRKSPLDDL